ncbi:hypothetical protein BJV77DRAFT_966232 [Russula vinacea]|nr:hypothetical protein BJV77DRAFT_966232 [Russula vinacea]
MPKHLPSRTLTWVFLSWLIHEENIPPESINRDGRQQGGIVLVAWSLVHMPLVGFLAHTDALPADELRALDPCPQAYCISDSLHGSFGLPTLSKYHPLVELTYLMEECSVGCLVPGSDHSARVDPSEQ